MRNDVSTQPMHPAPVGKRMLQGAAIGLLLILSFVLRVNDPKPEWGSLWMVRPLLVTPVAGAMGGIFYYFMDYLRYQGGWKKVLGIVVGLLGWAVALWMGIILGLAGTLWH